MMIIPISDYSKILENLPNNGTGDDGFDISESDEKILRSITETTQPPLMTKSEIESYYLDSVSK